MARAWAWALLACGLALSSGCSQRGPQPGGDAPASASAGTDATPATQAARLRALALGVREENEDPLDTVAHLYSVVMERRTGAGVETIIADADGTSGVYADPGRLAVGDPLDEDLQPRLDAMLDAGAAAKAQLGRTFEQPVELVDADPATAPPYPPMGHVQFFAVTTRGLRATTPVPIARIEAEPGHPLRALYDAGLVARERILAVSQH